MPFIGLFKRHSDTQRYNFNTNMSAIIRTLTSFPFIHWNNFIDRNPWAFVTQPVTEM